MQHAAPFRLAALATLLAVAAAGQSTIFVDASAAGPGTGAPFDPFVLIQDGIDAASVGDTVSVAPGTYVETIDFTGKDILVRGQQGAAVTTISGGQQGVVVTFAGGEGPGARLDGFTIADGDVQSLTEGGGILIQNASPSVENCVVTQNQGPKGGGIVIAGGSPTILRCTVTANMASSLGLFGLDFRGAGGICIGAGAAASIVECTISDNSGAEGAGGGIDIVDGAAFITHSIITGNFGGNSPFLGGEDPGQGGAGGVHVLGYNNIAVCQLVNSLVRGNNGGVGITQGTFVGTGGAGGVHAVNAGLDVTSCTLEGNNGGGGASPASYGAGGIHSRTGVGSISQIVNTIVWANASLQGTPLSIVDETGGLLVDFCCVDGGYPGVANLALDPQFVDPVGGNLRVTPTSPCLEAGDNAAPQLPPTDLDGNPRISNLIVDIGAYEALSTCLAGTVGAAVGPPVPVVQVNGLYDNFVFVPLFQQVVVGVDQPPFNPVPADYVIFLRVGPPVFVNEFPTPFGTLCFDPTLGFINFDTFVLLSSIPIAGPLLFPLAPQAPVSFPLPPIPVPFEFSLQGVIMDQPGIFAVTNLVHVVIG